MPRSLSLSSYLHPFLTCRPSASSLASIPIASHAASASAAMMSTTASPTSEYLVVGLGNHGSPYTKTRHNVGQLVLEHLAERLNTPWVKCRGYDQATVSLAAVMHAIDKDKVHSWMPKRPKQPKTSPKAASKRAKAVSRNLADGCPVDSPPPAESADAEEEPPVQPLDPHSIHLRLVRLHSFMNLAGDKFRLALRDSSIAPTGFSKSLPDRPPVLVLHDHLDKPLGTLSFKASGSAGGHNGIRSIHATLKSERVERLQVGIGRPTDKAQVSEYVLQRFAPGEAMGVRERVAPVAWALVCEWVERVAREQDGVPVLCKVGLSDDE
ncbi:peptidyl-tRNA hydrolase-domain-containing protein [Catenaria anguillulae PL171]|uniref:peptidyl-tRNA hydrolase n=1 Tax=Catenaria anguillulae PL171 TaxID=765915 RepID=A0A1Y2HKL4_9FUNG|nr:peptidyl-tRNA hydrolase-domain-containing protein [Catenaria anguillulae PL171]